MKTRFSRGLLLGAALTALSTLGIQECEPAQGECTSSEACGEGMVCEEGVCLTPCEAAGGTLGTALCCGSSSDFPNTCAVGACGCAPDYSHEVQVCLCPSGQCWNGSSCTTSWP